MPEYLGIDSSNYTSSAALCRDKEVIANEKQLLPVEDGALGLRQSDAVFHHVKNLPVVLERALADAVGLSAVGVSSAPREEIGSYMPCFLAGQAMARSVAAALRIPVYTFSHQAGHIMAALYSAGAQEMMSGPFIAFHVSGGTTEALLVSPDAERILTCRKIAGSLDLKAGQAVDRVGRLLGLPFPAGPALDRLAANGRSPERPRPTMKGADCCLSGIENQCAAFLAAGRAPEEVARYCIDAILAALDATCRILLAEHGPLPLLFAGGVMSNSTIRAALQETYGGRFAEPAFSSDNAAGVALLAEALHTGRGASG
ncbi:MAG: peptidase M22 [Candidatus Howiella sp.]|jgi:N6-L-threonylcarbamoyladenine synthase